MSQALLLLDLWQIDKYLGSNALSPPTNSEDYPLIAQYLSCSPVDCNELNLKGTTFNVFSYDAVLAKIQTHHLPDDERMYHALCYSHKGYFLKPIGLLKSSQYAQNKVETVLKSFER